MVDFSAACGGGGGGAVLAPCSTSNTILGCSINLFKSLLSVPPFPYLYTNGLEYSLNNPSHVNID